MSEAKEDAYDSAVKRSWLTRLNPLKRSRTPPVPEQRGVSPEYRAGFLSLLTFEWMSSIMFVGYQRSLELNDIWLINPNRAVPVGAERIKESFDKQVKAGAKRPLLRAIFDAYRTDIVLGGFCCLLGTLVQVILPFILKYLITFATDAFLAKQLGQAAPAIGTGVGWVFGLSAMQILGSIGNNHFMYRGMVVGGQVRAALISLIFKKAMTISGRAKAGWEAPKVPPSHIQPDSVEEKKWYAEQMGKKKENKKQGWSNGRIINLMSTDTNRIDRAAGWFHMAWVSPLTMIVTIVLLLINLTYSALPGIALFLASVPLMSMAVRAMFRGRVKANKITDQRVSLTQEVLQAIRFVKFYAWEMNFLDRIAKLRHHEIRTVQIIMSIRNAINAVGLSIPLFSSMLAFITYSLSKHSLNSASIFSSLTLFNQLRFPLMLLPMVIGLVTDALSAVDRIEEFLLAEDMVDTMEPVENAPDAVCLIDAAFTWEKAIENNPNSSGINKKGKKQANKAKKAAAKAKKRAVKKGEMIQSESIQPDAEKEGEEEEEPEPFKISNLNIEIGHQEFVAVVGGVGSGKSSLLAALAGDMRKISGTAVIGGSKAYCPQNAWIQNATVQDNITFGQELDEAVFEQVLDACTLRRDLDILPHGRYTEIGERGINLSGGQKQRVNLARAIYSGAEILLMDDPLSAVDAHVGNHIMEHAICGLLKDKCRILATHQLHVLRRCDRIMMMTDGEVTAFDTFDNLMENNNRFQEMMSTVDHEEELVVETTTEKSGDQPTSIAKQSPGAQLMQEEDKGLGTRSGNIYFQYFKATGSIFILPLLLLLLATSQGGNIATNLWLAWWTSDQFGFSEGQYIGVYAALGIIQAILLFLYSITLSFAGTEASKKLLHRAIHRVLRAPMSFFDTTPLGRIMNRFSKDIDTMDNNLTDSMRTAGMTLAMIISVFILIIAYYYYFAAALGPLLLFYLSIASYYHSSANEVKKHESLLRSVLFARFNEAIFGTTTIRAYGMTDKFMATINDAVDEMDSAYFLTFANQRWLGVRLDAIGVIMVFVTEMLVVTSRFNVSPSISGLILSYLLSIVQMLQFTVRQAADVDNAMISTERVFDYGNNIEQEAPVHTVPLPEEWPSRGEIIFRNVHMRYRPQLPLALKGFNLHVQPGERIGVVGRTGAGKSSIIMALFRMVELSDGQIEVDGMDIGTIGLQDLRSRMSIIPQDPTLFAGTVRLNLDPFQTHTDLELWSALRQAHLVEEDTDPNNAEQPSSAAKTAGPQRILLDSKVEEGGNNFSHGQRQLLALARALVRGSQIIICDEATSSIDFETDLRIQKAISDGFAGRTLLCIAHRLKTIIGYDRVCVIADGGVAEIGAPLALYDADGIFKSMCDQSSITRETIVAVERDSAL